MGHIMRKGVPVAVCVQGIYLQAVATYLQMRHAVPLTKKPVPGFIPGTGKAQNGAGAPLRLTDVDGLRTLRASSNLEFDFLTLTQCFKPVALDR